MHGINNLYVIKLCEYRNIGAFCKSSHLAFEFGWLITRAL